MGIPRDIEVDLFPDYGFQVHLLAVQKGYLKIILLYFVFSCRRRALRGPEEIAEAGLQRPDKLFQASRARQLKSNLQEALQDDFFAQRRAVARKLER
jgi:hypothetical protein